jgi:hypothetical protein
MGKYKDEWFDEFYGEYPEYDKPRWHTDFDSDTPTKRVKTSALTFDIYDIQDELLLLLLQKHEDYGPKNISNAPGGPLNGLNVRMYDKLARLDNLISNKKDPKNESLRDTFLDLANYAIIGLLVLDGKWDKK